MMALDGIFGRGWGMVWVLAALETSVIAFEALPLRNTVPSAAAIKPALAPVSATEVSRINLRSILDFQPFGAVVAPPEPVAEVAAPPVAPEAAPLVVVELVLKGVVMRDDASRSQALLAADGGPATMYAVGDLLPGGGVVTEIGAEMVRVNRDGQDQIIGFPGFGPVPTPAEAAQPDDAAAAGPITTADRSAPQGDTAGQAGAAATQADTYDFSNAAKPQIMPTPDLRNLIPGLGATPPSPKN